jgi:hypothetical protein
MEVSDQFCAPTTLPLQKEHPVPIEQEAGWVLEPLWVFQRRDDVIPLLGIKTPFIVSPAHCLVTTLTELFWLQKQLYTNNACISE